MKKRVSSNKYNKFSFMSNKTANIIVILIYFLASILYLNVLPSSITTNSLGIAFIVALAYGVICVYKNKKFLF